MAEQNMQNKSEPKADNKIALRLQLTPPTIPVLTSDEISVLDKPLGEGGYCTVSAVVRIKLLSDDDDTNEEDIDRKTSLSSSSFTSLSTDTRPPKPQSPSNARRNFARQFASYEKLYHQTKTIIISGRPSPVDPMDTVERPPKLALKRVKSTLEGERYRIGVSDLAAEVSVLAKCRHPNVISLYAVGRDGSNYGDGGGESENKKNPSPPISFAIIDQLRSTLKNKLYKWREDRGIGIVNSQTASNRLWLERMVVAHKLADALRYLHSKGILHRDIHPGNIGFTDDDVVKLFDFGLAKSVAVSRDPSVDPPHPDPNELFDLTGTTGTTRYMAPEIALNLSYNYKADVYSFSLVLHEILSLFKPYVKLTDPKLFHETVVLKGVRPSLVESWPKGVRDLLEGMWSSNIGRRLGSGEVCRVLGELLRGEDKDLYPKGWVRRMVGRQR